MQNLAWLFLFIAFGSPVYALPSYQELLAAIKQSHLVRGSFELEPGAGVRPGSRAALTIPDWVILDGSPLGQLTLSLDVNGSDLEIEVRSQRQVLFSFDGKSAREVQEILWQVLKEERLRHASVFISGDASLSVLKDALIIGATYEIESDARGSDEIGSLQSMDLVNMRGEKIHISLDANGTDVEFDLEVLGTDGKKKTYSFESRPLLDVLLAKALLLKSTYISSNENLRILRNFAPNSAAPKRKTFTLDLIPDWDVPRYVGAYKTLQQFSCSAAATAKAESR